MAVAPTISLILLLNEQYTLYNHVTITVVPIMINKMTNSTTLLLSHLYSKFLTPDVTTYISGVTISVTRTLAFEAL